MNPETKLHSTGSVSTTCQNCHKDFTIEVEDFNFYEKMKVPAPTWCPECRMMRRFSLCNTWSVFWRNCDKCKERTMSVFPPEQDITAYCPKCWWADDWDGTEYAMEYDSSRTFLEQFKGLTTKTPYAALESAYSTIKNCDYSNALAWSKDCYQIFWADYCESVYYSSILNGVKYTADCLRVKDSELCYESAGINKCYNTFFSEECDACVDVWFSRNCYNCTNCIGCVNLRGASYSIFNVKYSKEEYLEKVKELNLHSWKGLQDLKNKTRDFWLTLPYRVYSGNSMNLNVTGEYVFESKNAKEMYICSGAENCKWTQIVSVKPAKDCYDYSGWGNNASLIYESAQTGENANNIKFSSYCFPDSLNLEYCTYNISGKNNFGCVNLKRKSFCILNKEYSKEEYEKLREKIIGEMNTNPYVDAQGRTFTYGEFFPPEFSKFAYNNSNAIRFFPKTKEEAISSGYIWNDTESPTYPISLEATDLPDSIVDAYESILNETLGCEACHRAFKVTKGEFDILRKMNMPLPHMCPKCREKERFARLNPPRLYDRNCAKCNTEIRTAFAPDRPEVVYCEKCYQGEFI
ncbi:MAG: hypothetical protein AAB510_02965 [Patescibacteria group bacterium]